MHASPGQEKVEMQLGGCISGRVDLEVSVMGTWSGYGGMALSVLRSYCHRSIFHFNEVLKPNPYYLFIH